MASSQKKSFRMEAVASESTAASGKIIINRGNKSSSIPAVVFSKEKMQQLMAVISSLH